MHWLERALPKTIRIFDANVSDLSTRDILALLGMLPHLEILQLYGHGPRGDSVSHVPACSPALRILGLYPNNTQPSCPVFSMVQPSHLTVLVGTTTVSLYTWYETRIFQKKLRTQ
jgi:hypothetical protein